MVPNEFLEPFSEKNVLSIEAVPVRLPLFSPLRWGKFGQLEYLEHVIVRVRLDDGAEGTAEAPPRPTIYGETSRTIQAIIADEIAPRLVGRPLPVAAGRLSEIKNNQTARGGVDMALHAAAAQSAGRSLADFLGATASRIRVSTILGLAPIDATLAEIERFYELGVRVFKVKLGHSRSADVEKVAAIREAFGSDIDLYGDANEGYSSENAPLLLAELAGQGLLYCEEPLPIEEIINRAALRRQEILPLIADDSAFSVRDLRRELALDTFDILNIKPARTGYGESRRMWELATAAGKGIMVGSQAGSALGAARAGLFAALPGIEHPSELAFFLNCREEIVSFRPPIVDGYLQTADLLRVEIDEALLAAAHAHH